MEKQKKKYRKSLIRSMRRMVLLVALVIFLVSSLLCFGFMTVQFTSMFGINAQTSTFAISRMLTKVEGVEEYVSGVMETYRNLPEEIRSHPDTEEYRDYFRKFEESPVYAEIKGYMEEMDQSWRITGQTYIGVYDLDRQAFVYLLEPEGIIVNEEAFTGYWENVSKEVLDSIGEAESGEVALISRKDIEDADVTAASSFKDEDGNILLYVQSDISLKVASITAMIFAVIYFIVLAVIIILVVVLARIYLRKRLMKPIRQISQAAQTYARGKQEGLQIEECFSGLSIHTRDELQELSDVMEGMEKDIASYEEDLMKITAEKERIQTELTVAAGIQENMVPNNFPPFPERTEFAIYASMDPAKEVGGDFYDFFLIDDDHLGLVMADVSGKGIPAALFMMSAKIVISNFASIGYSPAEVLRQSNEKICAMNKLDMFVTVWFGILDLSTGVVTAASAGHEYPAVRHAGGDYELLHDRHGFVVGGMEGVRYRDYTLTLEPGSSLFLYTDGVPEANDARNQLWGTERMLSSLNRVKDETPEKVLKGVREDVDAFVQGAPQFDDLTMLCVTYYGKGQAAASLSETESEAI